jgi:hypothetical protein
VRNEGIKKKDEERKSTVEDMKVHKSKWLEHVE